MLKRIRRLISNAHTTLKRECGFTTVQLIITIAIIGIASTFAVVAIGHSRSAMRLSASERELASYLEQARTDSIRRHASAPASGETDLRAKVSVPANGATTYTVTMDFDKDGVLDSPRTISLQSGVTFNGVANTVAFDWRGRTAGEISIGLINERGSTSNINITGSGDITLNTDVFQDEDIPAVVLNKGDVSGDVIVDASPYTGTSNSSTGTTNTSTGTTNTSTGSTNTSTGSTNTSTGSTNTSTGSTNTSTGSTNTSTGSTNTSTGSTNTSTGSTNTSTGSTNTSTGSTNTSTGSTTTAQPCSMTVSASAVDLDENGGTTINITLSNVTTSTVITASPSNSGQIQVSPSTRTLTSSGTTSFAITVKKNSGSVSYTTSPTCGSGTTSLNVKEKK